MRTSREELFTLLISLWLLPAANGLEMEKFRPIKADIVLAIDTALGDVGRTPEMLDVEVIQHFLRKITMAFPLSAEGSRMAVVEFAASARVRLTLAEGTDPKAVDGVYDDVGDWYDDEGVDRNGLVDYHAMFRRVYEDIFTGTEGDRPDVPNMLMVLTIVPSFENEGPTRWRLRARVAALGSAYGFADPEGVVVTTGYATQRGTHLPKFTLIRGVGTFEPDAWFYQDFKHVLHYGVIHLRHAMRCAWVDHFYEEHQVRRTRTFDYTTCRADPAFVFKIPDAEEYQMFAADVVFAIEIDRSAPVVHHDSLRTLVLNVTRHLPISQHWIRFSALEFDRESNCRILANAHPGAGGCCMNPASLFETLIEKWAPETSPRYRSLAQHFGKDQIRVGGGGSGNLINLRALSRTVRKAMNQSGRLPQVIFVALVYPLSSSQLSLDGWVKRFVKSNGPNLNGGADALIVTSGSVNGTVAYTIAVSPLVSAGHLAWETASFEDARGKLFDFVVNVTKAAVRRCSRCNYNADRQCVIDVRSSRRNASGIEFVDGRFCQNVSGGVSFCSSERVCANECERRPWGEWGVCWPPKTRALASGEGFHARRRTALDRDDDYSFYRFCPAQTKRCAVKWRCLAVISTVPIVAAFAFG